MEDILVINSFDYTGKFSANKNRVFTRPGPKAAVQISLRNPTPAPRN